jgi:hypothetical protein
VTGPAASPSPGGTSQGATGPGGTGWPGAGWRGAIPEIIIAAVLVTVAAATAYALAGLRAVAVIVVISAACALVVLRGLVLPPPLRSVPEDVSGPDPAVPSPVLSSFSGLWRRQSRLADAQASMPAYEAGLRRQLENLLASRLAERHGISLYDDLAGARRVFTGGSPANDRLWWWIDPARPATPSPGAAPPPGAGQPGTGPPAHPPDHPSRSQDEPGLSYRTLAHLIDRLERL